MISEAQNFNLHSEADRRKLYTLHRQRVVFSDEYISRELITTPLQDKRKNAFHNDAKWQAEEDDKILRENSPDLILQEEKTRLKSIILEYPGHLTAEKFGQLVMLACTTSMKKDEIHHYIDNMQSRRWFHEYQEKCAEHFNLGPGWDAETADEFDLVASGISLLPENRVKPGWGKRI